MTRRHLMVGRVQGLVSAGVLLMGATLATWSCQKNEGAEKVVVTDRPDRPETLPDSGDNGDLGSDAAGIPEAAAEVAPAEAAPPDTASTSDSPDEEADAGRPDLPIEEPPANLPNGAGCQTASACGSGFCVDGLCCNTACDSGGPSKCSACAMPKTGQLDGECGPDRTRERVKCGEACGLVVPNAAAIVAMVCVEGRCVVPDQPATVAACGNQFDLCATNSCEQSTDRTARCVTALCPQDGMCCCVQSNGGPQGRLCLSRSICGNGRVCVTQ